MIATQPNSDKRLDETMISMCIKFHPTLYTIQASGVYFDRICCRGHKTTRFVQLPRQIIDTVTFFQTQICHVINTTGAISKASRSSNDRHAIDGSVTINNNSVKRPTRCSCDSVPSSCDLHTHLRKYFQDGFSICIALL